MRVGGFAFSVQAAVSQRLPVPVLLGRDVLHLTRLLVIAKDACSPAMEPAVVAVVTCSQKKQEELAKLERLRWEKESAA